MLLLVGCLLLAFVLAVILVIVVLSVAMVDFVAVRVALCVFLLLMREGGGGTDSHVCPPVCVPMCACAENTLGM